MCMNKLKRIWDRKQIEHNSTIYDKRQIYDLLNSKLKNPNIWSPLDSKYRVPTKSVFDSTIKDVLADIEYVSQYFDCDDFSFLFKGISALYYHMNSVASVISFKSAHAFNIIIVENNGPKVYKFEPQPPNYDFWRPEEPERDNYIVEDELILI